MSLSKAIEIIGGINIIGDFVQLVNSCISYLRSQSNNGVQEQEIQEHEVLQLQSDLRGLSETLPSMYNLLDRAEWRSHDPFVAELLPKLNDAVYDAEDLLDEFRWYEIKVSIEGNSTQQSLIEFFRSVTHGSFNKVTDIKDRLLNLSSLLEKMGLHEATPRFDKSVRPVTTSFQTEAKIFGRDNEIKEVVRLLGLPSKRKRACNAANSEPRAASVPVLPIVGLGGVGKTTLAQEITKLQRVKSHFDKIIWICVSDEFDAERFTKILIKSLSGKEATTDNFDDLQQDLVHEVGKKRFLLILDDIWPDALKEDGRNWRKFCAPLTNVLQGSMLLVTTRFAEVAATVGTMEYFALEGLKPDVFWDLFKLCVSGYEDYHLDSQLEPIGRSIITKLKGSPLAAMTIGRLLRKSLTTKHWNDILNSELWQLRQEGTDILPALRLSYMYLPFHLKRCFSFCAVYPKDYNFQKDTLAEIWVAEGFVEPQGNIPLHHIGGQYFEDLVNFSFFQKLRGKYVIHDLMHDMAQLVSKNECFIVKNASDFEKIPQNVRHLSILRSSGLIVGHLASLRKLKKLRTLLYKKSLFNQSHWVSELQCLRAVSLTSIRMLPENIGNLKHLRYLEISNACPFMSLPSSFWCLYYLQILYARKCVFESLPIGFRNMINLQKFEAKVQAHTMNIHALDLGKTSCLRNNSTITDLIIYNLEAISKDHAAEIDIRKMKYLNCLSLKWSSLRSQEHIAIEVLQALHPPTNLKSMHLNGYPGEYISWGFQGSDRPDEENIDLNEAPVVTVDSNSSTGTLSSLTDLTIQSCSTLKNIDVLSHECLPAIRGICVRNCAELQCLPGERFGSLSSLSYLTIVDCPSLKWQSGMVLPSSLETLYLSSCGDISTCFPGCLENLTSLQSMTIAGCKHIVSIPGHLWRNYLPSLKTLEISRCPDLVSIGGPYAIAHISIVTIESCAKLEEIKQPAKYGHVW